MERDMSIAEACPQCGRRLEAAANICTNCGFDRRVAGGVQGVVATVIAKVTGGSRGAQVARAWIVGLALGALLVGLMLAALGDGRFTPLYLIVVACYFVVAWLVGMLRDLQHKGLFGALMWFAPFNRHTRTIAVAHETVAPRVHHRKPLLEALFINAALALVSILVFGAIQIARHGLV